MARTTSGLPSGIVPRRNAIWESDLVAEGKYRIIDCGRVEPFRTGLDRAGLVQYDSFKCKAQHSMALRRVPSFSCRPGFPNGLQVGLPAIAEVANNFEGSCLESSAFESWAFGA